VPSGRERFLAENACHAQWHTRTKNQEPVLVQHAVPQQNREQMQKIDSKKELKQFYQASAKDIALVDVPSLNFLMVDGEGDPNTSQVYAEAVEALFSVSYTAKFLVKKGPQELDYAVMPLEGLWWADDMSAFVTSDKSNWKWTMMIMQPSFVSNATS
jgi:hypothetical protein